MRLFNMPNSAIILSQMHIQNPHPTNKKKSKGSGLGKEILPWSFEQNDSDIKVYFVFNRSAYMRKISSNSFILLGSKHFYL